MRASDILLRPYRKLRLTVKDINKGYYKGTRTGSMGRHTKRGGYVIEYEKVRTYVVPGLTEFKLTPFITKRIRPTFGVYPGSEEDNAGPRSPIAYLARWKAENGLD
ncbi:50S ribosomal protein 27 [Grosmannia clavigera kw1407]|uniref:50S ribosomal protein 27 n=1 Tax=Grosmannia clavigera (strain kw1407 / UAMH 11150) TaxID=655863 RepID=F0XHN0_GROCL|nr:50S ribosomal protein 27 [Grosmannia clavigera kw1407]EFX03331.1 50S ribosomal protein 27 [Grosmannia clavigera kw1407]